MDSFSVCTGLVSSFLVHFEPDKMLEKNMGNELANRATGHFWNWTHRNINPWIRQHLDVQGYEHGYHHVNINPPTNDLEDAFFTVQYLIQQIIHELFL